MRAFTSLIVLLAACATTSPPRPRPLGVGAHLAEAQRCEQEASQHDTLADEEATATRNAAPACAGIAMDPPTSGGERIGLPPPCWTAEPSTVDRHRQEAARLRDRARQHRALARALQEAEETSCATMPADELDHTPFAHREQIAAVFAELEGDAVRGARIQFRPAAGVTADGLRAAIACHRARAAAFGYDPTYMSYDPSVVAGAEVEVLDGDDGVVVVARGADDAAALVIYGRAEELLGAAW